KARRNEASKQISQLKKEKQDASEAINEMQGVSKEIKELDAELAEVDENWMTCYYLSRMFHMKQFQLEKMKRIMLKSDTLASCLYLILSQRRIGMLQL